MLHSKYIFLQGKKNQTRKLQRFIIHPNALGSHGKICPVSLLDSYLVHHNSWGQNEANVLLFPQVGAKYERVKPTYLITICSPMEPITYDNYRKDLKRHLDCETLRELGVFPADYSTHSFRKGSLSMLADGDMHPAFIQKSACHRCWESLSLYSILILLFLKP